jgi:RimJ/RimL family protein N-acetyltransferase
MDERMLIGLGSATMHLNRRGALAVLPPNQMISPRLIVRDYRSTDAQAVWQAIDESRPSLARWVPDIARRQTPAEVRAGLECLAGQRERGQGLVFGVWERASGDFVGEVGLYQLQWDRRFAELGYWLRQTARGRGYAAEALELVCAYARSLLELRHVEAHIAVDNVASRRVAERQGFCAVGQRPAIPQWDGNVDSVLIYTRTLAPEAN